MRVRAAKLLAAGALAVTAMIFATSAAAAPFVNGTFPVKGGDINGKIVAGPDGNMWVTLTGAGNNVARITPAGAVTEYELGLLNASGIALGPEGKLWVTATNAVASFSASDPKGTVSETTIVTIAGNSPIVAGPDGNLWAASENIVLRIPPGDPSKSTPFSVAKLSPRDIDAAGSLLAIADSGNSRIVTMTTVGVEKDIPLAGEASTSQGVAGSPSGLIGFSQSTTPEGVAMVMPPAEPQRFPMEGDPFGVAFGSDQAFWIARSAAGGVERLTPSGQTSFLGGLPPKFFPRQIAPGPGNTLWVTMEIPGEEIYEVARISGLEPPVTTPPPAVAPQTKIAKGPKGKVKTTAKRATVKFRFSSTTAGATFECALVKVKKLKKGQKAPKPSFKPCKSPKSFSLKPGRYRFWVRAVNAGLADPTPAKRSFSVVHVRKR